MPPRFKLATAYGNTVAIVCDGKCEKAWGRNSRPKRQLSDNEDDYEYLADSELGDAPVDPGTYEGGHGKPDGPLSWLNKWCFRECERCSFTTRHDDQAVKELRDFSKPVRNILRTVME